MKAKKLTGNITRSLYRSSVLILLILFFLARPTSFVFSCLFDSEMKISMNLEDQENPEDDRESEDFEEDLEEDNIHEFFLSQVDQFQIYNFEVPVFKKEKWLLSDFLPRVVLPPPELS